ncbi:MAG: sporulation protein, partial [Candidatus Gracilibacteria bacterium]
EKIKKFFAKIKLFLGIGTVKISFDIPASFSDKDKTVKGNVVVLGKSDHKITSITLKMVEEYSHKNNNGQVHRKQFTLGEIVLNKPFDVKQGEEKKVSFELPFEILRSKNDQLKEKGGVLGALGKIGSVLDNENSTYFIQAVVDVEAAYFDPTARVKIQRQKA